MTTRYSTRWAGDFGSSCGDGGAMLNRHADGVPGRTGAKNRDDPSARRLHAAATPQFVRAGPSRGWRILHGREAALDVSTARSTPGLRP